MSSPPITVEALKQQRMKLIDDNLDEAAACQRRSIENGVADCVILILDVLDPFARAISKTVGGPAAESTDAVYEQAVREQRMVCRFVAVYRPHAIKLLAEQAPQLGALVPNTIDEDKLCVVALSAGGSYCALVSKRASN